MRSIRRQKHFALKYDLSSHPLNYVTQLEMSHIKLGISISSLHFSVGKLQSSMCLLFVASDLPYAFCSLLFGPMILEDKNTLMLTKTRLKFAFIGIFSND